MKNINTQQEENLNIMNVPPVTFTDRMMLESLYSRYSRNKRAWSQYRISDSDWYRISKQICSQIDAIEAVYGKQLDLFLKHFN